MLQGSPPDCSLARLKREAPDFDLENCLTCVLNPRANGSKIKNKLTRDARKRRNAKMKFGSRGKALAIAVAVGVALVCVAAYSAATTEILLAGTIPDSQVFNGPVNVTVRVLTLKPGDKLPWHYHPGYAFNVVKSGTETVEDGCGGQKTLTPGQGFEEIPGRVHRGRNLTDKDVVVYD